MFLFDVGDGLRWVWLPINRSIVCLHAFDEGYRSTCGSDCRFPRWMDERLMGEDLQGGKGGCTEEKVVMNRASLEEETKIGGGTVRVLTSLLISHAHLKAHQNN
jgi:hypothetical protein